MTDTTLLLVKSENLRVMLFSDKYNNDTVNIIPFCGGLAR